MRAGKGPNGPAGCLTGSSAAGHEGKEASRTAPEFATEDFAHFALTNGGESCIIIFAD